jgi:hypothetical protein
VHRAQVWRVLLLGLIVLGWFGSGTFGVLELLD